MSFANTFGKVIVFTIAFVVIGGMYILARQSSAAGGVVDWRGRSAIEIVLNDDGFVPRNVRISKGTSVTFSTTRKHPFWPASDPHPSHTIYPGFDPKNPVEAGSSWTHTFDVTGRWGYHDHLRSFYTGVIYVE